MTWLVDKLSRRIQFLQQEQIPQSDGGYKQAYKKFGKVWASLEPISPGTAKYIRGVQVSDEATHKFVVRKSVPMGVCTAEIGGYVKADNFFVLLSTHSPQTGRMFRILGASNNMEQDEYIQGVAKEVGVIDTERGVIV